MSIRHVRSRAPLRISLAGGGTDIENFSNKNNGAVINIAISKYAFCDIKSSENGFIAEVSDLNKTAYFDIDSKNIFKNKIPINFSLHWNTYKYVMERYNNNEYLPFKVITYCDSPVGSGLGSSSALVVSMLKGWNEILNLGLDEYKIAQNAIFIERKICNFAGGKQDQYSASFGGINFIEFTKEIDIVHPLKIKTWFKCELESSLILHYTGVSRESNKIINDQINFISEIKSNNLKILNKLRDNAYEMKNALLTHASSKIIDILNNSRELKSKTSNKIESDLIKDRIDYAYKYGANAAKVSGAGGGGFILFFINPEKAIFLRDKLRELNENTFLVKFCEHSSQSWTI